MNRIVNKDEFIQLNDLVIMGEYGGAIKLWNEWGGRKIELLKWILDSISPYLVKDFRDFVLYKYQGNWNE
jgi:hypothetical protein